MKVFKSKKELEIFIIDNLPFAVKPTKKSKYQFVSVFTSSHAMQETIKELTDSIWSKINENQT